MHNSFHTRLRLEDMEGRLVPSAPVPDPGPGTTPTETLIADSGTVSVRNLNTTAVGGRIHIETADGKKYDENFEIATNESFADLAVRLGDALSRDGWDVAVNGTDITVYAKTVNGVESKVTGIGFAVQVPTRVDGKTVNQWQALSPGTTGNVQKLMPVFEDTNHTVIKKWNPAAPTP